MEISDALKEFFEDEKDGLKDYAQSKGKLVLGGLSDEEEAMYKRICSRYEESAITAVISKATTASAALLEGPDGAAILQNILETLVKNAPLVASLL